MDYITIQGVRPWDGRYEFDLGDRDLTTREWGFIKRLSGYLPLTIDEGLDGADPELFATFAAIALCRAGKISPREVPDVFERLADAPFGSTIKLEGDADEAEGEADPDPKSSGNGTISGDAGPTNSANLAATLSATGTPVLDSSASGRARSGN